MARAIDADALVEWLTKPTGFMANCEGCTEIDCLDCIIHEAIMNAPTIEAESVKHGKWEIKENEYGDEYMQCTNCKEEYSNGFGAMIGDLAKLTKFCPNCGARMDGE